MCVLCDPPFTPNFFVDPIVYTHPYKAHQKDKGPESQKNPAFVKVGSVAPYGTNAIVIPDNTLPLDMQKRLGLGEFLYGISDICAIVI